MAFFLLIERKQQENPTFFVMLMVSTKYRLLLHHNELCLGFLVESRHSADGKLPRSDWLRYLEWQPFWRSPGLLHSWLYIVKIMWTNPTCWIFSAMKSIWKVRFPQLSMLELGLWFFWCYIICFTGYTVIQGYTTVRNQQNRFRRTLPSTWIKDQNAGFHFCSFLGTRLSTVFLKAGSGHPHRWGFDPHDQQQFYHVMNM